MSALPRADNESRESPFKSLEFFVETDESHFAGRSQEISAVVTGILSNDTFVLYGRSGLGKTSLLLAGIFPQLKRLGYDPQYLRLLDAPVMNLRAHLLRGSPHRDVVMAVREAEKPIILALDQFEEFFIRLRERPNERKEFSETLGRLIAQCRGKLRIVFGIREDHYTEIEDFRTDIPNIAMSGFRLMPLTAYGAREAILLPVEQARVDYEERLINRLVDELAKCAFDPLLLQIICTEVWRRAQSRPGPLQLKASDFDEIGGVNGIFRQYVEGVGESASIEQQLLVRTILDTLTTAEHTKRTVRAKELAEGGDTVPLYVRTNKEEVGDVLTLLLAHQLVREVKSDYGTWYELLHDRLVTVVQEWLQLDQNFVRFRFAKTFVSNFAAGRRFETGSGYLLSFEQMEDMIDPWRLRLRLNRDETELLFRSAIAKKTPSLQYWTERIQEFGADRVATIVGQMLASDDEEIRAGAASALPQLPQGKMFVPALLNAAVHDTNAGVRQAAASAFATLASDEELHQLKTIINDRSLRDRGMTIVIEAYDQVRAPLGLPLRMRIRAWRALQKRNLQAHRDSIGSATRHGALVGTIGGVGWSLLVAVPIYALMELNRSPEAMFRGVGSLLAAEGFGTLLFAVAGLVIGLTSARREANRAATEKLEMWRGGTTRGFWQGTVIAVLAETVILAGDIDVTRWSRQASAFSIALFLVTLIVPAIAALSIPAFRVRDDRSERRWGGLLWVRLSAILSRLGVAAIVCGLAFIKDGELMTLMMVMVLAPFASAPIAVFVRLLHRGCGARDRIDSNTLWAVVASGAVAAAGIMGCMYAVERQLDLPAEWMGVSKLAMIAIAIGAFRGGILSVSVPPQPLLSKARFVVRAVLAAALVLSAGTYLDVFGVKSIPGMKEQALAEPMTGTLATSFPNSHYYKLTPADNNRVFMFQTRGVSYLVTSGFGRAPFDETHGGVKFAAAPFRIAVPGGGQSSYSVQARALFGDPSLIVLPIAERKGVWRPVTNGPAGILLPFVVWDPIHKKTFVTKLQDGKITFMSPATSPLLPLGGEGYGWSTDLILQFPPNTNPASMKFIAVRYQ